jgi:hypothetical protein
MATAITTLLSTVCPMASLIKKLGPISNVTT